MVDVEDREGGGRGSGGEDRVCWEGVGRLWEGGGWMSVITLNVAGMGSDKLEDG